MRRNGEKFSPMLWASLLWAAFVALFFLARVPLSDLAGILTLHGTQTPSVPEALRRAAALGASVGAGAWILFLTLGIGSRISRRVGLPEDNPWSRTAWESVWGMAALQVFWMGTGFNQLWRAPLLWGTAIALTGWFLVVRGSDAEPRAPLFARSNGEKPFETWLVLLLAVGSAACVLGFVVALLPETFYDSMAYVLSVPQQWLLGSGIPNNLWHMYDHFTLGASLWFLNGLFSGGEGAARLLSAVLPFACALLAGGWARSAKGPRAGWIVFGLLLAFPLMALNSWACRSDVFTALMLLAAFHALRPWRPWTESETEARLFAAGVAFGMAVGAKYVALAAVPAAVVFLLPARGKIRFRAVLWGMGGMALAAGPWVLRNWMDTGNPLFPYLPGLFGSWGVSSKDLARVMYENRIAPMDAFSWPPLPWRLTQPGYGLSQTVGPTVLALLPLPFLFHKNIPGRKALMWAVSLFFAASLALSPALRFAFAGFGLYFILVGSSLESAPAKARSFWGWVTTAGAAAGFLLLLSILGGRFAPMDFWLLRQDAASYSRGRVHNDPSPLVSAARLTMSPRDVLLLVGDGRALSYPCRVIWNSVHDEPLLATCARTEKDGEGFSRRLRRLGVSYVGFNLSEGSETGPDYGHWDLSAAEREKMFLWCETHLEPIRAGAGWALLRVCEVGVAQGMPVTFWEEAFPLPQKGSEK